MIHQNNKEVKIYTKPIKIIIKIIQRIDLVPNQFLKFQNKKQIFWKSLSSISQIPIPNTKIPLKNIIYD